MAFLDLARERYSCRKYQERRIEKETLEKILEAGRIAPSAVNFQPWHFVVVDDDKLLSEIKSCYKKTWIQSAPAIIVVCGDHQQSWKRDDGKDHCDIDIAIATDHLTLAASDAGLGTCWVCKFDMPTCKQILQLPDNIEPVVLLPIGYPDDTPNTERHNKRKALEEVVHWNKF